MPELPEVETIRRQLEKAVKGKKIVETEVFWTGRLNVRADELKKGTEGAKIVAVKRRAKLLMIELSNGRTMAVHLGMTGRVLVKPAGEPAHSRHTFAVFRLSGGTQLMWDDYRRFGFLKFFDEKALAEHLKGQKYGPEPLASAFDAAALAACLMRRPKQKLKERLMDQSCVAGIGNIYAAEALFHARLRPDRPAGRLTAKENALLLAGIKKVLSESISNGGTSADSYVDSRGEKGSNVSNLKVYGRDGKPCRRKDGGIIKKDVMGGRGTFWCPVCQK